MNDKGVGAIFCLISSILISAKYLSAAIFVSNTSNKDAILFSASLEYVGSFLTIASLIALIIGLLFLGYGLYQDVKGNKK
ncbi:MAG: hypothetical protein ACLU79_12085 [Clostridium sp.]